MKTELQNSVLDYFKPLPLFEDELEILAPRKKPHMLDWLQHNYYVPEKSSRIKGLWNPTYTPFWKTVINWFSDSVTREIWVYAARQTGKSTILNGCLIYVNDVDPGPTKLILPDDKTMKKRMKRLKTVYELSPRLLKHLQGDVNKLFIGEVTDFDNMQLYLGHPSSPITLEDDPIRYLFCDEVALWKVIESESNVVNNLRDGTRTYEPISKRVFITRPGNKGDLADTNFNECQEWSVWIICPHCCKYHKADFNPDTVWIDKDKDGNFYEPKYYEPAKDKRRKPRAAYTCPHCKEHWTEYERKAAISGYRACPDGCVIGDDGEIEGDYEEGKKKSIRFPAVLIDPVFTTIEQLAVDFVSAIKKRSTGDISSYRSFINNQNAQVWEEKERETSLTQLQRHVSDYRMGEVPRKVQIITHGIDVQADHVWVNTKGYGFRNESWLINAQKLETGNTAKPENWDIVEKYIRSPWFSQLKSDIPYYAMKAGVDCRYQRDEESTVVYDFCLRFPEGVVLPVMGYGRERMHNQSYKVRDVIGKALKRFDLNVDNAKDKSWQTLFNKEKSPGPGYMHLPNNLPNEFLRQLASESQKIKRTRTGKEIVTWSKKEGFSENHLWDANGYADFAAEMAGVFFLQDVDYVEQFMRKSKKENLQGREVSAREIRTHY